MREREERDPATPYLVTYYVTFEVEARHGTEAREKGEEALLAALKDGTIGDYISEDSTAEVA